MTNAEKYGIIYTEYEKLFCFNFKETIMKVADNETARDRFKRLAAYRTNTILERLRVLGNCANRQVYEYTKEDIDKIFAAIEKAVKETRTKFQGTTKAKFKL